MARAATQQPLPLRLVDDDWRLDERTREVGRRGLAEARAALAAAARRTDRANLTGPRSGRAA
ncbi:MAG TPA: hypothetical protein VFA84_08175 [Acidimicrobiales bacterium]|nr:hypothetical protein [Acidimicrobiales bacterium]